MINLSNLKPSLKAKKKRKVVGRGNATGRGTYSGRGIKGQKARSGGRKNLKRLGLRRIILSTPKLRGFTSLKARAVAVNLGDLDAAFKSGDKVTPQALKKIGLIDNLRYPVKILGGGRLTKRLVIEGCKVSSGAADRIKKAGGKIVP